MATSTEAVKQQVIDTIPKRIKELKFGLATPQDIIKQGVLEVCDRALFDLTRDHAPAANGPLDARMGISGKSGYCETCGESLQTCNGHFGYIKLALPALHIGYFKQIIIVLQAICKDCANILLHEKDRRTFLRQLRRPNIDTLQKTQICRKVIKEFRRIHICPSCGSLNGKVKKTGTSPLKIVHERFSQYDNSKAIRKVPPKAKLEFEQSFETVRKIVHDVERNIKKAQDDLNPLKILNLFKRMNAPDCELLGMNPAEGRPEMFVWQYFPVAPVCIRPSVPQDGGTTEDDITSKVSDIVHINTLIAESLQKGQPLSTIMEQWDFLQLQVAMIINSEMPGIQPAGYHVAIRGLCQRLKGKQGRFRGNLSGKRVDFSGRTVISPDPNLAINEVAIPELIAKNMTFPEKVSRYNLEKMRRLVRNGPGKWPGANYVVKRDSGIKQFLKYGKASLHADNLKIGDLVERHLEDQDIVLFNRQPSLHKLSILAHYVKVRPCRTFRLNECVCNPYNADFDGDEMNLHVPQTEEARTEAVELMGVKNNLSTPRNGEPIIAAIQDFITGAYLLSNKDNFYDRKSFSNICMYMVEGNLQIDLPPPAILKPVALWTGKQVFNVLMRPNHQSQVRVNLDAACREYRATTDNVHRDLDPKDAWLCIRNSEVMCGVMDKSTVGAGKKDSVFYAILRDFGADAAIAAMNRLARLCARWLSNQGFSIGIGDVRPGRQLKERKQRLVEDAYAECDALIHEFTEGKLAKSAGCDEEQTMETKISGILSKVRQAAGDVCFAELSKYNTPMLMATCGSKGSSINVSQMVAVVGQQIINQQRVQEGFQDRTLPHFPKNARQPPSKGFVRNSFFSGLTPSEFIFHAMSGREGLVDTAVKTAETGYMSRRLMKSLEDLSVQYDDTVRNSSGAIVQYQYGDDKLDPTDMEAKARPVHFERAFTHAEATTWSNSDPNLLPSEITDICDDMIRPVKQNLTRKTLLGKNLDYLDQSPTGVDDMESARNFIQSIEKFVNCKASERTSTRERLGLSESLEKHDEINARPQKKVDLSEEFIDRTAKLSRPTLRAFIGMCMDKYRKAEVEPGSAVGAIGAQSIGEPGTQMTLKTFHFAGIANMQVTQGVPRIKEIINASRRISTPIISCELNSKDNITAARLVKGRIEQTFLRDIVHWIEDVWSATGSYISLKVDFDTIGRLQLDLKTADIIKTITTNKKLRLKPNQVKCYREYIRIDVQTIDKLARGNKAKAREDTEIFARMQFIRRILPNLAVSGYPGASRAVIKTNEEGRHALLVEGYGLKSCMTTQGVNGHSTRTNSIIEMRDVLGIEAARTTIIDEISTVMGDMDIDPRHMQLLADVMTYKGEVLGITRFGLSKMRDSVLQLASFEKTPDHLFEAAWHAKRDKIEGVSECIIMGQSMNQGTGAFQVVRRLGFEEGVLGKKKTVFEDVWGELRGRRRRK